MLAHRVSLGTLGCRGPAIHSGGKHELRTVLLAGVVATLVYFVYGFLVFGLLIVKDYAPYPGVYRSAAEVQIHIPVGLASTFVAILVLAAMYAKGYEGGAGFVEGARFGLLVGLFVVFAFVADEYVTLNIGRRLAAAMAAGRLFEWIVVGMAIGIVYKPARASTKELG